MDRERWFTRTLSSEDLYLQLYRIVTPTNPRPHGRDHILTTSNKQTEWSTVVIVSNGFPFRSISPKRSSSSSCCLSERLFSLGNGNGDLKKKDLLCTDRAGQATTRRNEAPLLNPLNPMTFYCQTIKWKSELNIRWPDTQTWWMDDARWRVSYFHAINLFFFFF